MEQTVTVMMAGTGFGHDAVLYDGLEGFVAECAPFVEEAIAEGAATLVLVDEERFDALRDRVGAGPVEFVSMPTALRNPGRIISRAHDFVARHPGRPLRGLLEPVWAGRDPEEVVECLHHEHLLNLAFREVPQLTLRCAYDVGVLPVEVIEEAARAHAWGSETGGPPRVADVSIGLLGERLSPVPERATCDEVDPARLRSARASIGAVAATCGFVEQRVDDVVLVVDELLANSIEHGGGRGHLCSWSSDGRFYVEVWDRGVIVDPLVGRRRVRVGGSGRGLWLVHELADLVQVRSGPGGTRVRVRFDAPRP